MTKRIYLVSAFVLIAATLYFGIFRVFDTTETAYVQATSSPQFEISIPAEVYALGTATDTHAYHSDNGTTMREVYLRTLIAHQQEQVERQKIPREREIAKHNRMQVYLETVKNETIEESLANLLLENLPGDFQAYSAGFISDPMNPLEMEYQLKRDPRVAKIYNIIEHGNPNEQEILFHELHRWIEYILTNVSREPHFGDSRFLWTGNLQGALMYPLILAELAPSEDTIAVIRELALLQQETAMVMSARFGPSGPTEMRSPLTTALGLALERVVQSWQASERLTAEQIELVGNYEDLISETNAYDPSVRYEIMLRLIDAER